MPIYSQQHSILKISKEVTKFPVIFHMITECPEWKYTGIANGMHSAFEVCGMGVSV